ncbi:MAG TPA: hypothetical protein VEA69_02475 [Tepidisphaeraceae bacterium]|nr:hypothetical protein [Tepidisphaeraceae bacterium]
MSPRPIHRVGSLEIDDHMDYQYLAWRLQRVGWALMALLLLAATLGAFGSGPLAQTNAGAETSALWVKYERFGRLEVPQELVLNVKPTPEQARAGKVTVWVSRPYADQLMVDTVVPTPDFLRGGPDRVEFDVQLTPDSGDKSIAVTLYVQHQNAGKQTARAGVAGGPSVDWWEFIYP